MTRIPEQPIEFYSARDLGLTPGAIVRIERNALDGNPLPEPPHLLHADDLAQRDWVVLTTGPAHVCVVAIRKDHDGNLLYDEHGQPLVASFTLRELPADKPVFAHRSLSNSASE